MSEEGIISKACHSKLTALILIFIHYTLYVRKDMPKKTEQTQSILFVKGDWVYLIDFSIVFQGKNEKQLLRLPVCFPAYQVPTEKGQL